MATAGNPPRSVDVSLTWFNRNFFGLRALLHHLAARVDVRSAEERECPLGPVDGSSD
jgi:hypothetical protein